MSTDLNPQDLRPNWYALMLCIIRWRKCVSPETAFALLYKKKGDACKVEVDIETLIKLKKTMTYKEIGRIYGLTPAAVYNRIRYHRGYRVPGKERPEPSQENPEKEARAT